MPRANRFPWVVLAAWAVFPFLSLPCGAQTPPRASDVIALLAQRYGALPGFQCDLQTSTWTGAGWTTVTESLRFQAPDKVRVQTPLPNGRQQVSIFSAIESVLIDTSTGIRKVWARNLFTDWARGYGGPANVCAFGTDFKRVEQIYRVGTRETAPISGKPVILLHLTPKNNEASLVLDFARSGGSGLDIYYAPYKRKLSQAPAQIRLYFAADNYALVRKEVVDDAGNVLTTADVTAYQKLGDEQFPSAFDIHDRWGTIVAKVQYTNLRLTSGTEASDFVAPDVADSVTVPGTMEPLANYQQRLAADPGNADLHYVVGLIDLNPLYDIPGAQAEFDQVIKAKPRCLAPHIVLSDAYLRAGNTNAALLQLNSALQSLDTDPALHIAAATCYQARGETEEALKQLHSAAATDHTGAAGVALATALVAADKTDEAVAVLGAMLRQDDTDGAARVDAADGLARLTTSSAGKAAQDAINGDGAYQKLARNLAAIADGQADANVIDQTLALMPDNLVARMRVATAWLAVNAPDRAMPELQQIVDRFPGSAVGQDARRLLVGIYATRGDIDAAMKLMAPVWPVLSTERTRTQERNFVRTTMQKCFLHQPFIDWLKKAVKTPGAPAEDFRLLANLYQWEGDVDDWLDTCTQLTNRFPSTGIFWSDLASAQIEKTDADAKAAGSQSVARRDYWSASKSIQQAKALEPWQPYYMAQLAFLYSKWLRLPVVNVEKAGMQRLYPDDPDVLAVIGTLDMTTNPFDTDTPMRLFTRGLESGVPGLSDRWDTVFYLRQVIARLWESKHFPDRAAAQWQILLQSAPDAMTRTAMRGSLVAHDLADNHGDAAIALLAQTFSGPVARDEQEQTFQTFSTLVKSQPSARQAAGLALDAALQQQPNSPALLLIQSALFASVNDKNGQETALGKAAAATDAPGVVLAAAARVKAAAGKTDEAAALWQRCVRTPGTTIDDYQQLGVALAASGKHDEAVKTADRLALLFPATPARFRAQAAILLECGKAQDAVKQIQLAVLAARLSQDVSLDETLQFTFELADISARAGDTNAAEQLYKKLTLKQCGVRYRTRAHFSLAALYRSGNRPQEAIEQLRNVLNIAPDDAAKKRARDELQQLGVNP